MNWVLILIHHSTLKRQESLGYMNGQEPEYNDNTVTSWNELATMSMMTFQESR